MGLTQEISLNICAHFDPLTCYQDYTQNVLDPLLNIRDAIPDCAARGGKAFWKRGGPPQEHCSDWNRADRPTRRPRIAVGTAATAAPAIGRSAVAPSNGRFSPPQSPPAQVSPLRRRRRDHLYRPPAIIPVPPRTDMTPPIAGHPPRVTP